MSVTFPGAGPFEVEQAVLEPLEQLLGLVPGVVGLRGRAREGEAVVEVRFAAGDAGAEADRLRAAAAVRAALADVAPRLPTEASPPGIAVERRATWVYAPIADDAAGAGTLRRQLEMVAGVVRVDLCGVREPRVRVEVDPLRLAGHGLTLEQLAAALTSANVDLPAGRGGTSPGATLRVHGAVGSLDELGALVVGAHGVTLRDVATVSEQVEAGCVVRGGPAPALIRVGVDQASATAVVEAALGAAGVAPLRGQVVVARDRHQVAVVDAGRVGPALVATVRGDDAAALAAAGTAALEAVRARPEVTAAGCTGCATTTTMQLVIDRDRAATLGVSPVTIARTLGAALGQRVATFDDGDRALDVVLAVGGVDDRWGELQVATATGGLVPLADLVRREASPEPAEILHLDRRRAVELWAEAAPGASVAVLRGALRAALPAATVVGADPTALVAADW